MAWAIVTSATRATSVGTGQASPWSAGALGAAVAVGNRVMVVIDYNASGGSPAVSAVTDSLGNTYRKEGNLSYTAGVPQELSIWSAPVTTAGTPTLSVTFAGGTGGFGIGLAAAAFSGLSTASDGSEIDVAAKITNSATASGTTTGSTTAANELVIGFYGDWGSGQAVTVGAGYTAGANNTADGNSSAVLEYKDSGSSGVTVSSSVTNGDAAHAATGVIVFALAGGAPAATSLVMPHNPLAAMLGR